jgi:hypothetical protein
MLSTIPRKRKAFGVRQVRPEAPDFSAIPDGMCGNALLWEQEELLPKSSRSSPFLTLTNPLICLHCWRANGNSIRWGDRTLPVTSLTAFIVSASRHIVRQDGASTWIYAWTSG